MELEEPDSPAPRSPSSRWPSMVANRWPSTLLRASSAGASRQASLELPPFTPAGAAHSKHRYSTASKTSCTNFHETTESCQGSLQLLPLTPFGARCPPPGQRGGSLLGMHCVTETWAQRRTSCLPTRAWVSSSQARCAGRADTDIACAGGGLPNGGLSEDEPYSSGGEGGGIGPEHSSPSKRYLRTPGAGGAGGAAASERDLHRTQQAIVRRFGDQVGSSCCTYMPVHDIGSWILAERCCVVTWQLNASGRDHECWTRTQPTAHREAGGALQAGAYEQLGCRQ